ncbi:MAG: hypothetical protein DLM67_21910 [Candidatus Nephthysia bennettiae]|uniref:GAF domain-containing protein n=1 Tax=Candidatus Nephthysia bennettiae TaxID=3127016 RepID=A0A934K8K0_9BACT|nr:hypothetical protein [Candidatus Dormibacteraeota bacterium]MBJ7613272.1 hypothetical protein [Candidatus Dormibacteraeota bacterium]PZR87509.1 MAG: hypothetical protein DLM67_21910 [Candidatus Dormibacteraeota bacterium]
MIRDNIKRSDLENALNIPMYICVLAAPVRRGSHSIGTVSLGSFRAPREARLDRPEARDLLMTIADAVSELWESLDDRLLHSRMAEQLPTVSFSPAADSAEHRPAGPAEVQLSPDPPIRGERVGVQVRQIVGRRRAPE